MTWLNYTIDGEGPFAFGGDAPMETLIRLIAKDEEELFTVQMTRTDTNKVVSLGDRAVDVRGVESFVIVNSGLFILKILLKYIRAQNSDMEEHHHPRKVLYTSRWMSISFNLASSTSPS
jgi:hypothetical protein